MADIKISTGDKLWLGTKGLVMLKKYKDPKQMERLKKVLEANGYPDIIELLDRAMKYM